MVGQGAFGKVMLSRIKATGEVVAVKIVNKELIQKLGKTRSIFRERDLLNELQHPFIIKLIAVTMDDENLYFVFENCENGDLADLIQTRKSFSLEVTRIYAAQMVQCLDYLQKKEVMHRDLKP
jgi:serine/threonine protein kinase